MLYSTNLLGRTLRLDQLANIVFHESTRLRPKTIEDLGQTANRLEVDAIEDTSSKCP